MKRQHLILGGALVLAGWLALFGDKTPANTVSDPVTRSAKQSARIAPKIPTVNLKDSVAVLVLQSRHQLIGATETGSPTKVFASQNTS